MIGRIIETEADIAEGAEWLAANHPPFARALAETGPLPLRRRPGGFANLLNAIIGQQVSTASANAIWERMRCAGLTEADAVAGAGDEALRACGLSRQKIAYAQALAASGVDYAALQSLPDHEVIETLIAIRGIGRWTAEIYAMFSLGRVDMFAPGDLALQEAARQLHGLQDRPSERRLRVMAEDWSPWRGVAARALWAYYRVLKNREGIR